MDKDLELKIENFWALLDGGKYRECHDILDNSKLDIIEKSTMKVAVYFRELRYKEAYDFAFDSKNKCSNYIKGLAAFKHSFDIGKKDREGIIGKSVEYLEMAISDEQLYDNNKILAQITLIDSYFLLGNTKKSFSLAKKIVDKYPVSETGLSVLKDNYQVYLVDAFNPNNTLDEKRENLFIFLIFLDCNGSKPLKILSSIRFF